MDKRHRFRPDSLGPLETRLALSGAAASLHGPAAISHAAAARATASPPGDRATRTFEINFLAGMIPHHRMAIDMARLAMGHATDPQVKGLARRVVAEQRPEVARMNRYLAVDGVRNYRPGRAPDEAAELDMLGSRRGPAFDRAFLMMMIEHHTMAVEGDGMGMVGAREAEARVAQPGLRALAAEIVAAQTAEISEMREILARLRDSSMS